MKSLHILWVIHKCGKYTTYLEIKTNIFNFKRFIKLKTEKKVLKDYLFLLCISCGYFHSYNANAKNKTGLYKAQLKVKRLLKVNIWLN